MGEGMTILFCIVHGLAIESGLCLHRYDLGPCLTEDDANCYWNATRIGDGLGQSYINADGTIYTWEPKQ